MGAEIQISFIFWSRDFWYVWGKPPPAFSISLNRNKLGYLWVYFIFLSFSKAITSLSFLDTQAEESALITHPSSPLPPFKSSGFCTAREGFN